MVVPVVLTIIVVMVHFCPLRVGAVHPEVPDCAATAERSYWRSHYLNDYLPFSAVAAQSGTSGCT